MWELKIILCRPTHEALHAIFECLKEGWEPFAANNSHLFLRRFNESLVKDLSDIYPLVSMQGGR